MSFALIVIGKIESSILVHAIRLVLDTPLYQDLILFLKQVIKILNNTNGIFGIDCNASCIIVYEPRRVDILILDTFIKHNRERSISFLINPCR
ncbi:hypothetical protein D3C75_1169740 [compost metagenome]